MTVSRASGSVRVVLFATPRAASDLPVPADFPAAMLPLGHAAVIVRLIEQVARCGITQVDIVACDRPELLRRELGDGERWGVHLQWHLAKNYARPYAMLRSEQLLNADRVLIGHADRWIDPAVLRQLVDADHFALCMDDSDALVWAGWAGVPGASLGLLPTDCDERALRTLLARLCPRTLVLDRDRGFARLDAANLLRAQRSVIAGSADAPLPAAWIPMPWGAVSPTARVHPGAIIEGPVLIGPRCLVAEGAIIGPNAVLSGDVVVCARTRVRKSLVLAGTYLGSDLEVSEAIVDGGRIRHVALGVETFLPPSEGLALRLVDRAAKGPSIPGQIAAGVAALMLVPVVAAAALLRKPQEPLLAWKAQSVVVGLDAARRIMVGSLRCPHPSAFRLRMVAGKFGGLLDVVLGRRCWFGVRPRRSGEWYALSAEWQSLLASAPIGLFYAPAWSDEEDTRLESLAAADAFYAVRRSWRENVSVAVAAARALFPASRRLPKIPVADTSIAREVSSKP